MARGAAAEGRAHLLCATLPTGKGTGGSGSSNNGVDDPSCPQ